MIFEKILLLSLAGTGALALSALIAAVGRRALSQRLRYYIAVFPALFFLLPVSVGIGLRVNSYSPPRETPSAETAVTVSDGVYQSPDGAHGAADISPAAEDGREDWLDGGLIWRMLSLAWAAGVCALAFRRTYASAAFRRMCARVTDDAQGEARAVFERIKGKTKADLRCFRGAATPFTAGIFRPTVYILSVKMSAAELEAVLSHELTHIRRRDMLIKTAAELVKIIHFFNPAAYILTRRINTCCELSCDEAVVRGFSDARRREYGRLLLGLARGNGGFYSGMCLCGDEKDITRRIENIMKTKKTTKLSVSFGAALAALTLVTCTAFASGVNTDTPLVKIGSVSTMYYIDFASQTEEELQTYMRQKDGGAADDNQNAEVIVIPQEYSDRLVAKECKTDGRAVIVNSPAKTFFYASFTASDGGAVYAPSADGSAPDKALGGQNSARFEVRLTSVIKRFTGGSDVEGLFTVRRDGNTVGENLHGYINNITPVEANDVTAYVNIDVNGTPMTFYVETSEYDREFAELDSINYYENLCLHPDTVDKSFDVTSHNLPVEGDGNAWMDLDYNRTTNQADFTACIFYEDFYVIESYGDMTIDENTLRGNFYLKKGTVRVDSFAGTVTDNGDSAVFVSDDGKYHITGSYNNSRAATMRNGVLIMADGSVDWWSLIKLSQKGDALTWSDFAGHTVTDASAAFDEYETVLIYKVSDNYNVILSGSKDAAPDKIELQCSKTGNTIDIRYNSVYDFVKAQRAV